MPNIVIAPSIITIFGAFLGLVGILIWWLMRRRRQRVWMPVLRVLEIEGRPLPKLVINLPPAIPFLCFCLATLGFIVFLFEPKKSVVSPLKPNSQRVHVLFDLSTSVSSQIDISSYGASARDLIRSLVDSNRVTYSFSNNLSINDIQDPEDVYRKIMEIGFHRPGIKIGESIKANLETLKNVNRLIIASDGDHYSWSDFSWEFLKDTIEVRYWGLGENNGLQNFYINSANYLSSPGKGLHEWEVEIIRSGKGVHGSGALRVYDKEKELHVGTWNLPIGRDKVKLRVRYNSDPGGSHNDGKNYIKWVIEPSEKDAIASDNIFYTQMMGAKGGALLVADHGGENFIDDPAYHLKISLEVLGFKGTRYDKWTSVPKLSFSSYPLWVLMVGMDGEELSQCPARSVFRSYENREEKPIVWISPAGVTNNWRNTCRCFARIVDSGENHSSKFCEDVQTRGHFIGVLKSVGAKQVGGDLGRSLDSLAWRYKIGSGVEALVYTVPLKPTLTGGFTYSSLPMVLKSVAGWQELFPSDGQQDGWPRIADFSKFLQNPNPRHDPKVSNIPSGESDMAFLHSKQLPPKFVFENSDRIVSRSSLKNAEDPLPWLKLVLFVMIIAGAIEALFFGFDRVFRLLFRKKELIVLMIISFMVSQNLEASVSLNVLGWSNQTSRSLAQEVSSRTSITLGTKVINYQELDNTALKSPWLWVDSLDRVVDKQKLRQQLVEWIKRGGFLVVENANDINLLESSTNTNWLHDPRGGWISIPPDHELMRSFHLLESLPSCVGETWRGFQFDGRLAIIAIPGSFLELLVDQKKLPTCKERQSHEKMVRVFINVLMVALATDYKKDQIHLPEILKRLR